MLINETFKKSTGIILHNYEVKFLQNLFEEKFYNDLNLIFKDDLCKNFLREFFEKTNIRYVNINNDQKFNIICKKFKNHLKEEVGRSYHSYNKEKHNNQIDDVLLDKTGISIEKGISSHTGKNNVKINTKNKNQINKTFNSEEEAELYLKNSAYKIKNKV